MNMNHIHFDYLEELESSDYNLIFKLVSQHVLYQHMFSKLFDD